MKKLLFSFCSFVFINFMFCTTTFSYFDYWGYVWQLSHKETYLTGNDEFNVAFKDSGKYIIEPTSSGILEIKYDIITDYTNLILLEYERDKDVDDEGKAVNYFVKAVSPIEVNVSPNSLWDFYIFPGLQIYSEGYFDSSNISSTELKKLLHTGVVRYSISPGKYYFSFYNSLNSSYNPDETVHFTATFTPDAKTSPETGIDNNIYTIIGVFLLSVGGAVIIKQNRRVKP